MYGPSAVENEPCKNCALGYGFSGIRWIGTMELKATAGVALNMVLILLVLSVRGATDVRGLILCQQLRQEITTLLHKRR